VRLSRDGGLRGTVVEAVYAGDHVRVAIDSDGRRLHAHVAPPDAPRAGEQVGVILPDEHLWRLPSGRSGDAAEVADG
ncbi:MAG: TOBE domain-containing protein, partial [Actinomycetota bacterium]|nr:TOBE domain-containing protein [Actinomycetota bacterium]